MTEPALCPHGDLLDACIDCTVAPPKPEPVPPVRIDHTFTAYFSGQCPTCDLPIHPGRDVIAAMTDGTYHHARCVR